MDNAGAVVGPLIAWALLASDVPLKEIFLWSALPAALCVILAMYLKDVPADQLSESPHFNWRDHRINSPMKRYLIVVGLFSLGNASSMFLLLRAGELGIPQQDIPLLWAAVSIIPTLFSTPLAAWSDKIGRVRLLLAGYTAYGAVYVVIAYLGHASFWLFALYALYGLFLAATEGVEKALVADLAPSTRQGTAFGWFNMVTGFCLLPASIIFGWLYQDISASTAFMFSGCCAFGSALLMLFWWKRFNVSPSPH
jgi:MFS family permease